MLEKEKKKEKIETKVFAGEGRQGRREKDGRVKKCRYWRGRKRKGRGGGRL